LLGVLPELVELLKHLSDGLDVRIARVVYYVLFSNLIRKIERLSTFELERILNFIVVAMELGIVKTQTIAADDYLISVCLYIQKRFYDDPFFESLLQTTAEIALQLRSSEFWNAMLREYLQVDVSLDRGI
jgi:hypothetical protein